eukprot:CAMPEP_0173279290 /NCGR_PEP_ID=MMETSP1143-20121109/5070_1 /TAXON_ID=483371 /ORGANISM="non described non described, Strain CCMP2298" /LENGTH=42 /DNA_ID= /DNA_START= /DNA_END= /DNA_ORIENTATION=
MSVITLSFNFMYRVHCSSASRLASSQRRATGGAAVSSGSSPT